MKKGQWDGLWAAFSVLVAIAALAFSVFVFLQDKTKEESGFSASILSKSNLVNTEFKDDTKNVKLTYAGKPVDNLTQINLEISNTGGKPIKKSDFEGPITIDLCDVETVIRAEKVTSDPVELQTSIAAGTQVVTVDPVLFNAGDKFVLGIYAIPEKGKGSADIENVTARIVGVKSVDFRKELTRIQGKTSYWRQLGAFFVATMSSIVAALLIQLLKRSLSTLEILEAKYGTEQKQVDATKGLNNMIRRNKLFTVASNNIAGDPHKGQPKVLSLRYSYVGKVYDRSYQEGEVIDLP